MPCARPPVPLSLAVASFDVEGTTHKVMDFTCGLGGTVKVGEARLAVSYAAKKVRRH